MKEYFQNWGSFYEVLAAFIFGIISIILWLQDRKKTKLIKELQNQTNILQKNFEELSLQNLPTLSIYNRKEFDKTHYFDIKNEGSHLYEMAFDLKSKEGIFKIVYLVERKDFAKKEMFQIRITQIKDITTTKTDLLVFRFKDRFGVDYTQSLHICSLQELTSFEPPKLTKS